jgi:cytochrome c2
MTFLRVMGFSLVLLLFYALYSNSLPQVEPDLSEPIAVSTDGLDMDGMIALGETLFTGKGTCTLCHNNLGRAPDTLEMDLAAAFAERLADPRYEGVAAGGEGAEAVEKYLRESLQDPSAFVVAGFGKKGSNDTVSPMPVVNAAPIELTSVEMNAVIAFLQDRAAMTPTVPLPSADEAPVAKEPTTDTEGMVEGPETDLIAAFDKYSCAACHDLNDSGADIGPALGGISGRMNRAEVMLAIIDPDAQIAEGYDAGFMPADFGETMHVSELTLIADYLLDLPEPEPSDVEEDEDPATTALGVMENYGCAGCHDLDGSEADLGPALNGIASRMNRDQLKAAIIDPNAEIAEGYEADMMPDTFGEEMADSELQLLLDYLTSLPE